MRMTRNHTQKLLSLIFLLRGLVSSSFRSKPFRQRLTTAKRFPTRFCFAIIAALVLNVLFSMPQSAVAQSTFTTQRANGKIAFVSDRDGNSEIYVMNPDGGDQTNITHNSAWDGLPAWSPDGRKIAFSSNRDGSSEIYVMNADGTGVTRLTYDFVGNSAPLGGIGNFDPDWSPDGRKIAFTSWRGDLSASGRPSYDMYVMNADGSNEVRLTNGQGQYSGPDWSPDGTRIAFASNRDRDTYEIYVMNADGSGQTNITKNGYPDYSPDNLSPDWSPDGTKILFVSLFTIDACEPGYPCGVFVMNADGSNPVESVRYGYSPVWSPDGTRIAYVDYSGFVPGVNVMNADGSNRTRLTQGAHSPAWQPLLAAPPNPIDDAQFFVRQQYLDFLNREPDQGGWDYWTDRITQCGSDARCIDERRIGVSAAFFVEQEFQDTGYYVYRFYKASFGRQPTFAEFTSDRSKVIGGSNLEASKQAFADEWVRRPAFRDAYPITMSNTEVVNKLFDSSGLTDSGYEAQRQEEIQSLNDGRSRALVLRDVIEIPDFKNIPDPSGPRYSELKQTSQYNAAFVLMQYFGYLRRDVDEGGYNFWLNVLNTRDPNNFRGMVCSFITSAEYQLRFGSAVTRSNAECGRSDDESTFTTIDFPGANISTAWAINSAGDIIGTYTYGDQHPQVGTIVDQPGYGFILSRGSFTSIKLPGAFHTLPYAINDNGTIVGVYEEASSDNKPNRRLHCFQLSNGDLTSFDFPGAKSSSAWGINSQGEIVGVYRAADDTRHGFLLHDGEFTSIDYPGAILTWARGITPSGDIMGLYTAADGTGHGFLLHKGEFASIDYPGASFTNALGINARGDIVGRYDSADGNQHGYVLSNGRFTSIDFPGASRTVARGINLRGEIVGEYIISPGGKAHAFLLSGVE